MRWLLILAAVQQVAVPFFVNPFAGGHASLRDVSTESGIEPAGYAFSIWGPIYFGALAYAMWQATAAGRADPATERVLIPALILYLGSSLWLWLAQYGPYWGTMPVLAVMAGCAIWGLWTASTTPDGSAMRWWAMVLPFALYAGWTTAATFVNIAEVAPGYGWDRFGLGRDGYALLSLAGVVVVGAAVLFATRGNLAFAATLGWALAAIIVAARARDLPVSIIWASAAAMAAILLLTIGLKVAPRS